MRGERGHVDIVQRGIGARLVFPHIDAARSHLARTHGISQRVDVVDAAACRIHHDDAVFHARELRGAEHSDGFFGLGKMHRDEIGQGQHVFKTAVQRHAQCLRTLGRPIGVESYQFHAKRFRALGNQPADAAEPADGKRLFVEFRTHVIAALPLMRFHGRVGSRNLARACQQQRHGLFGSGNDVRRRRVAYHDPVFGGSVDIDVVHTHTRTPDDREIRPRADHIGRHLRGAAHDERIVCGMAEISWSRVMSSFTSTW